MTIMELHNKMTEVLADCVPDVAKFQSGNKSAGLRLRKSLKELRDLTARMKKVSLGKSDETAACPEPNCA